MDNPSFQLTPLMQRYILHWGEMGSRWGVNRTVSQIHALLYLSPEPLNAEQITELLSVARSNVSNSLKELQSWELVKVTHVMGDRRDHFSVVGDTWDTFFTIIEQRKRRELDPIMTMLRQCEVEMGQDKQTSAHVRKKITEMHTFLDGMLQWYEQIATLPRSSLLALIKMGTKVIHFLPKKKAK
ncbi:MarR family transcriptional regulator [Simiduia curdlanivorans]|uniref:HTH-type transcriptional regulator n=1 Tax=Simiduia curdlanivorans TaxID=1492769 RepID=A0ABV8V6G1_9GAMM|nr:MarR family transcriptional regulator [Simiduia curdlanivorans]MDN3640278.1 MarR family transcriptional regulator [Simiduia curdlanivorans]